MQLRVAELESAVKRAEALRERQLEAARSEEEMLARHAADVSSHQRKVFSARGGGMGGGGGRGAWVV